MVESVTKHIMNVNVFPNAIQGISESISIPISKMEYIVNWTFETIGVIADIDTEITLSVYGGTDEYMSTFLK